MEVGGLNVSRFGSLQSEGIEAAWKFGRFCLKPEGLEAWRQLGFEAGPFAV